MSAQKFNQLGTACRQAGIFSLWLIIAILVVLGGGIFFGIQVKPWIKPFSVSQSPMSVTTQAVSTPAAQQVKKNDIEALEKYCKEEALKLPEASITYKSKEGPTLSGPLPWVNQFIPKDKKEMEKKGCTMAYHFDGRTGYGSVGAKYPGGGREFDKEVRIRFLDKIDSSWEIISGNNISNDSLTMVLKRENSDMGTVDFVDIFDGGLVIYIKFNTYYK